MTNFALFPAIQVLIWALNNIRNIDWMLHNIRIEKKHYIPDLGFLGPNLGYKTFFWRFQLY